MRLLSHKNLQAVHSTTTIMMNNMTGAMMNTPKKAEEVRDPSKDANELVDVVLPRCNHRPLVYNKVTRLARQLEREAELLKKDAQSPRNYVLFLPNQAPNTCEELAKDVLLLDDILSSCQLRPFVFERLMAIKNLTEDKVRSVEQNRRESVSRRLHEHRKDMGVLWKVLPFFADHPHVHNHVVMELQRRTEEGEQNEIPPRRLSRFSLARKFMGANGNAHLLTFKAEPPAMAMDRWADVEALDTVMDTVHECKAKRFLEQLKKTCRNEAKSLQQKEAGRMAYFSYSADTLNNAVLLPSPSRAF